MAWLGCETFVHRSFLCALGDEPGNLGLIVLIVIGTAISLFVLGLLLLKLASLVDKAGKFVANDPVGATMVAWMVGPWAPLAICVTVGVRDRRIISLAIFLAVALTILIPVIGYRLMRRLPLVPEAVTRWWEDRRHRSGEIDAISQDVSRRHGAPPGYSYDITHPKHPDYTVPHDAESPHRPSA